MNDFLNDFVPCFRQQNLLTSGFSSWRNPPATVDSTEYTEEKVTGLLRVDRAALQKVTVMVPDKTDKTDKDTKNTGSFDAEEENEEEVEQVEQVVTQLVAIPTNHSNQGVSLSTLSLSGLSKADQERLFTMMLREIDGTTIRSNGK